MLHLKHIRNLFQHILCVCVQAPQFVDIPLAEDDSSDEEYRPDEEDEDETAEDVRICSDWLQTKHTICVCVQYTSRQKKASNSCCKCGTYV